MKMILKVLFIQRICSYDGEYAPEALVCVDEYSYSDNPAWFNNEVETQLETNKTDIYSHAIIDIEVDYDKIFSILNRNPKIQGKIL